MFPVCYTYVCVCTCLDVPVAMVLSTHPKQSILAYHSAGVRVPNIKKVARRMNTMESSDAQNMR